MRWFLFVSPPGRVQRVPGVGGLPRGGGGRGGATGEACEPVREAAGLQHEIGVAEYYVALCCEGETG